jgi:Poxvirus A32 protein
MAQHTEITLHPIDFSQVPFDALMFVLGRRGMGKTLGYKSLLKYMARKSCYNIMVFCGNPNNITEWREILPASFVGAWDEVHAAKIMKDQGVAYDALCNEWVAQGGQVHEFVCPMADRLHIVLDDLGFGNDAYHSKVMDEIANNGRHKGVGVTALCQYYTQLPRTSRSMADLILMATTIDKVTVEAIYNMCLSMSMSLTTFKRILAQLTKAKGHLMVINNKADDMTDLSQRIYTRRNILKNMKFQCISPVMQAYHDEHYLSDISLQRVKLHTQQLMHFTTARASELKRLDAQQPMSPLEARIRAIQIPLFDETFTIHDAKSGMLTFNTTRDGNDGGL